MRAIFQVRSGTKADGVYPYGFICVFHSNIPFYMYMMFAGMVGTGDGKAYLRKDRNVGMVGKVVGKAYTRGGEKCGGRISAALQHTGG
jgi:hypothetical protein